MPPRTWAKSKLQSLALLRKRQYLVLLISTCTVLGLYVTSKQLGFDFSLVNFRPVQIDSLWEYPYVNASDTTFPPHDPAYVLFEPPSIDQDAVVTLTPQRENLPSDCLDAHFTSGTPCYLKTDPKLDIVWTWVNGSDRLFQESLAQTTRMMNQKVEVPPTSRPDTQLFRDHDELRHSVRSVVQHFSDSVAQLHVVTSDFELRIPTNDGHNITMGKRRLGLVPRWLDPDKAASRWYHGGLRLMVKYHSEIFRAYEGSSFNSYAIESQLVNLGGVADHFIYMNDDFFMTSNLSASDFYTSAYGIVLRMQADLLVQGNSNPIASLAGEWGPLQFTNWCLNNRFGSRKRPYIAHAAKALSLSLMKEFTKIWKTELAITASHPFRGMKQGQPDIYFIFLFSHSVVERWREALLWSWVVGKIGGLDDKWGTLERESAWRDVGGMNGESIVSVNKTVRRTLHKDVVDDTLRAAGHFSTRKTEYVFASGDGYPYDYPKRGRPQWPLFTSSDELLCTLDFQSCFNKPGMDKASEVFKHIAFEEPQGCGDCIIHALRAASGAIGLAAFLPDGMRNFAGQSSGRSPVNEPPHLPLVSDWRQGDFSLRGVIHSQGNVNIRGWTLRLLERYRFVLGQTSTAFHMIATMQGARTNLKKVDQDKDLALLCLNDNLAAQAPGADQILREWQEQRWPHKADWER